MKNPEYYQHIRTDIIEFLPSKIDSVLEVGCGVGMTLNWLKKKFHCHQTIGVEINTEAANEARSRVDIVHCGDIETIEIDVPEQSIDLILCLDVLEHLKDPWSIVSRLKPMLRKNGILIACIPNTRNFHVSIPLLFCGEWNYTDDNLLDKTHLRFFTRQTAIKLFEDADFEIVKVHGTGFEKWTKSKIANIFTFGMFQGVFEYEYIISAKKITN
jgi:2-polyprenyl-3-methyl-5-hydroxy-6-metoxy-1,4-benzoquinol methylase